MPTVDDLKRQIADLDELISSGVLKGEAARKAREDLEAQLLAEVTRRKAGDAGPKGGGKASGKGGGKAASSGTTAAGAVEAAADEVLARPSSRLVSGIVLFVLAVGIGGYAVLGTPEGWSIAPGSPGMTQAQSEGAAADGGHTMGAAQIEGLIDKLSQRLKESPADAEGWAMLGRSYSVLGRHTEAIPAYRKVIELRPDDAQGHADLADALGSAAGKKLDGEPEQLIAKALKLDPDNIKALSLDGTIAFNRGKHAQAAKQWERALTRIEPGSELARQLQGALDEARQRAGLPPLAPAAAAAPAPSLADLAKGEPAAAGTEPSGKVPAIVEQQATAAPGAGSISGQVTLDKSLQGKASPDDTLFVFARPISGSRAPLAILRKQVKDLPLKFTLDDSLSMSPQMRLSTAGEVVVGARISKAGTAMSQPGDLQGQVAKVKVGTKDLQLVIGEVVR